MPNRNPLKIISSKRAAKTTVFRPYPVHLFVQRRREQKADKQWQSADNGHCQTLQSVAVQAQGFEDIFGRCRYEICGTEGGNEIYQKGADVFNQTAFWKPEVAKPLTRVFIQHQTKQKCREYIPSPFAVLEDCVSSPFDCLPSPSD